jgi:trimeric autotransporter adhesin
LCNNTTGNFNTAVGKLALSANTTANDNTAVGFQSLCANTTGCQNIVIGSCAMINSTTARYNEVIGFQAGNALTTGCWNTIIGRAAAGSATTAIRNVVIGADGSNLLETGTQNVTIGDNSDLGRIFTLTTQNNRGIFGHNQITNAYVKVAWTVTSDLRDKTNFGTVPHGLDFVNQLEPVSFQFKKSREDDTPHGDVRYGFKAQDILALEGDNPVIIDDEQPDHLKYKGEHLVPVLVNAIKELKARIETLENK